MVGYERKQKRVVIWYWNLLLTINLKRGEATTHTLPGRSTVFTVFVCGYLPTDGNPSQQQPQPQSQSFEKRTRGKNKKQNRSWLVRGEPAPSWCPVLNHENDVISEHVCEPPSIAKPIPPSNQNNQQQESQKKQHPPPPHRGHKCVWYRDNEQPKVFV
jgi:hypothetical protein